MKAAMGDVSPANYSFGIWIVLIDAMLKMCCDRISK